MPAMTWVTETVSCPTANGGPEVVIAALSCAFGCLANDGRKRPVWTVAP